MRDVGRRTYTLTIGGCRSNFLAISDGAHVAFGHEDHRALLVHGGLMTRALGLPVEECPKVQTGVEHAMRMSWGAGTAKERSQDAMERQGFQADLNERFEEEPRKGLMRQVGGELSETD